MSIARAAAQIVGFLVVLVAVIAAYNVAARVVVERALSQAKNAPPFPTTRLETNFDIGEFKGFGDDFLYKPERGRFGDR
jgi:hypothetical protein